MAITAPTVTVNLVSPASQTDTNTALATLTGHINTSNANLLVALQKLRDAITYGSANHRHRLSVASSQTTVGMPVFDTDAATAAVAAIDAAIAAIP